MWVIFGNPDFQPVRLQAVLGHRQMPLGHFAVVLGTSSGFGLIPFPEPEGWTSGYWRICLKDIFATHQGGPRVVLKDKLSFRTT